MDDSKLDDFVDRFDVDGSYIPRHDEWYYGHIPNNCTRKELVKIMAIAFRKWYEDEKYYTNRSVRFEDLVNVLDLWFEHDYLREKSYFEHLVNSDNDFDDFVEEIRIEYFKKSE